MRVAGKTDPPSGNDAICSGPSRGCLSDLEGSVGAVGNIVNRSARYRRQQTPGFCWRPVAATTSINIDIDGAYNLRLRVFISRNPLQRTQPWPPATGAEEMPATTDVAGGYIFFFAA